MVGSTERQTDRQTGRQAGRQGGRQAGRQAGKETGRQTDSLYTGKPLNRAAFTQSTFYTQKLLHRAAFAQRPFTAFTHRAAFTHRGFYTEQLLAFAQPLHTKCRACHAKQPRRLPASPAPAIEPPRSAPATPNHCGVRRRPPAPRRQSRQRASYRVCRACHAKPPRRPAASPSVPGDSRGNALAIESPVPRLPNTAASPGVPRRPRRQSRQRASYRVPKCRACHAKPPRRPPASLATIAAIESPSAATPVKQSGAPCRPLASPATIAATPEDKLI